MSIQRISASNCSSFKTNSTTNFSATQSNTATQKGILSKEKLPYVAAGIALATLAGVYILKRKPATTKEIIKKTEEIVQKVEQEVKQETPKIIEKPIEMPAKFESTNLEMVKHIKESRTRCRGEYRSILLENTHDGIISLDNMDKAAEFRALDKTRPNYLHEAANMLEESYKEAYQKAEKVDGQNLLDKIANRFEKESKALPNIYAKMPKEEALERINIFTKSAFDLQPKQGMSPATLFDKIVEFMEQVKV